MLGRFLRCVMISTLLIQSIVPVKRVFGAWASGGGELYFDKSNPWFLPNLRYVRYCIDIDESNFGLSAAQADRVIKEAFSYWRREFRQAYHVPNQQKIMLAQNTFIREICDENTTDLKFQLGRLHHSQHEVFRTINRQPKEFVGIAVRTHYDRVTMRGRGFIYLSAYPNGSDDDDLIRHPWSQQYYPEEERNYGLLHKVLVHEIGHIFGIGHWPGPSDPNQYQIMDHDLPRRLISKQGISSIPDGADIEKISGFFAASTNDLGQISYPSDDFIALFDLPSQEHVHHLALRFDGRYRLDAYLARRSSPVELGSLSPETILVEKNFLPVVSIYIPPDQRVFAGAKPGVILQGPGLAFIQGQGTFVSTGGVPSFEAVFSVNPLLKQVTIAGTTRMGIVSTIRPILQPSAGE